MPIDPSSPQSRTEKAEREIARAACVALIDISAPLEAGTEILVGAGNVTLALVVFAARGRRLLRSAVRLIDAGDRDTAVPLFRVMTEYFIVGRWLLQREEAGQGPVEAWARHDLRRRLTILNEVRRHFDAGETIVDTIDGLIDETTAAMQRYGGDDVPLTTSGVKKAGEVAPPSIEAMAAAVGLGYVYSVSYRLQSQADVHATPLAIDNAVDLTPDGYLIRPMPEFAHEHIDSYRYGAHLLLDILRPLLDRLPELEWRSTVETVSRTLSALPIEAERDPAGSAGDGDGGTS